MCPWLHLAERAGAEVHALKTATAVRPAAEGGYLVEARRTARPWQRAKFAADQVVFAAGALGTQRLLHRMKTDGILPRLSDRLGALTRTTPSR